MGGFVSHGCGSRFAVLTWWRGGVDGALEMESCLGLHVSLRGTGAMTVFARSAPGGPSETTACCS